MRIEAALTSSPRASLLIDYPRRYHVGRRFATRFKGSLTLYIDAPEDRNVL